MKNTMKADTNTIYYITRTSPLPDTIYIGEKHGERKNLSSTQKQKRNRKNKVKKQSRKQNRK